MLEILGRDLNDFLRYPLKKRFETDHKIEAAIPVHFFHKNVETMACYLNLLQKKSRSLQKDEILYGKKSHARGVKLTISN